MATLVAIGYPDEATAEAARQTVAGLERDLVIQADQVLDAQSLPKVKMPNSNGFADLPEWKHGMPRLQNYP